mmetsp:Transcript_36643/g.77240  ORF Transcript_36643/g.77240 Transcript_36643/m.77240 type:complete len:249 (+) Transcript_36643:199-945(+)
MRLQYRLRGARVPPTEPPVLDVAAARVLEQQQHLVRRTARAHERDAQLRRKLRHKRRERAVAANESRPRRRLAIAIVAATRTIDRAPQPAARHILVCASNRPRRLLIDRPEKHASERSPILVCETDADGALLATRSAELARAVDRVDERGQITPRRRVRRRRYGERRTQRVDLVARFLDERLELWQRVDRACKEGRLLNVDGRRVFFTNNAADIGLQKTSKKLLHDAIGQGEEALILLQRRSRRIGTQ